MVTLYGPFYRIANPSTQSLRTAVLQLRSGELWGRAPRGGFEPTVKAYRGTLPDGQQGVEFFTSVTPNGGAMREVRWYPSLDREVANVDYATAKIEVRIEKVRYACKHD